MASDYLTEANVEGLISMLESEPEPREGDSYMRGREDALRFAANLLRDLIAPATF